MEVFGLAQTRVGHYKYFALIVDFFARTFRSNHLQNRAIPTVKGSLVIHPKVRANCVLMWLIMFRKNNKVFSIILLH